MIQVNFSKMRYTSKRERRDFMEFLREVNGQRLFLVADEEYQKEAEDMLTFVEEYFEENWDEVDTLIPIHYGQVKVIPKGEDFQVLVQNYEHKLLNEWIEDFSYFLEIIRKTIQTGKRTKTLGRLIPFRFDGPLVIANHTFEVDEWYAHRFDDETWYIAPIDQTIDPQPLEGNQAYEIFPDYPELYEVMHLPTDFIILFKGHDIVSVLNTDSVDVWN